MKDLRELNMEITRRALKENISRDIFIIQAIHTIDELVRIVNKFSALIRERYGYYAPRLSKSEDLNELFDGVFKRVREDVSVPMTNNDLNSIEELVLEIKSLSSLVKSQEIYLESLMKDICPNLLSIASALIGARLIDHAGSLKHLAELPSSTIQVLGAEKALFRHLKTGSKAPKFGVIFAHQSISNAENKGKASRRLASEISKAVKIDYFRKTKTTF